MEKQKMRLIVASNNANKLREFREILGEQFDIVSMHEAGIDADIEENGTTFEENALIKANYVMNAGNSAAIADDSGLEVDALRRAGCLQRTLLRPSRRRRRQQYVAPAQSKRCPRAKKSALCRRHCTGSSRSCAHYLPWHMRRGNSE